MNIFDFIYQHLDEILPVTKQLLVFIHLFAFAFAIVMILSEDLRILISKKLDVIELNRLAGKISYLLAILWLTGIGLLAIKPGLDPELIFSNSKLAAKITVVSVLTINGLLLHLLVFPNFRSLERARRIVGLSCILTAISTTSWIYAGMVGAARAVAPIMSYRYYLDIYLVMLAFALLVAVTVVYPLMRKIVRSTRYPETSGDSRSGLSAFFSSSLRELGVSSPAMKPAYATGNARISAGRRL